MNKIIVPMSYNYIGAFLTFACNFNCKYCINQFNSKPTSGRMTGDDWTTALNRIVTRDDLPITLQGGEPTLHKDFYQIVNSIPGETNIDLMTNCSFDIDEFTRNIKSTRIRREAPYASIRVSYHPGQQDLQLLMKKVKRLQDLGYHIGIWTIDHPEHKGLIQVARDFAEIYNVDFRLKEFLGEYDGKMYGEYKYPDAITGKVLKTVKCKTTELLIGPDGCIYRCHSDLYAGRNQIGHILDANFKIREVYRQCTNYGDCNPCDVKVKTNRFQIMGHTSVDIKELE